MLQLSKLLFEYKLKIHLAINSCVQICKLCTEQAMVKCLEQS